MKIVKATGCNWDAGYNWVQDIRHHPLTTGFQDSADFVFSVLLAAFIAERVSTSVGSSSRRSRDSKFGIRDSAPTIEEVLVVPAAQDQSAQECTGIGAVFLGGACSERPRLGTDHQGGHQWCRPVQIAAFKTRRRGLPTSECAMRCSARKRTTVGRLLPAAHISECAMRCSCGSVRPPAPSARLL